MAIGIVMSFIGMALALEHKIQVYMRVQVRVQTYKGKTIEKLLVI